MFTRSVAAKLSRRIANLSCVDVLKDSAYKGPPPELMSMFLCFRGAVEKTNAQFLIDDCIESVVNTSKTLFSVFFSI